MHQRGWRQLPNYALWHGIFTFIHDIIVITLSSCGRCLGLSSGASAGAASLFGGRKARGSGRGYNQVPTSAVLANGNGVGVGGGGGGANGNGNGRREDDNRLLDELDEEWDH